MSPILFPLVPLPAWGLVLLGEPVKPTEVVPAVPPPLVRTETGDISGCLPGRDAPMGEGGGGRVGGICVFFV